MLRKTWIGIFSIFGVTSVSVWAAVPEPHAVRHSPALVTGAAVQQQSTVVLERRIHVHDLQRLHWLLSDPSLPQNVTDSLPSLNAGEAVWLTLPAPAALTPAANENRGIMFYHNDHLGSSNVMTDRRGALVQEVAYFPFGEVRHSHEPGVPFRQPYGFTGKEQDAESGLHYFEARYMAGRLSRFITPDPKFANPGTLSEEDLPSYLAQPQKANPYSYVLSNPLNHVDPTGLDDEDAKVAASVAEGFSQASQKMGGPMLSSFAQGGPPAPVQGNMMQRVAPQLVRSASNIIMLHAIQPQPLEVSEAGIGGPITSLIKTIGKVFTKSADDVARAPGSTIQGVGRVGNATAESLKLQRIAQHHQELKDLGARVMNAKTLKEHDSAVAAFKAAAAKQWDTILGK